MQGSNTAKLIDGFNQACLITKKFAKTFYFASRLLDKDKRNAAYSVYAICRISDDAVDISSGSSAVLNLNRIKEKIETAYNSDNLDDNLLFAFKDTIATYNIPKEYFDELIKGIDMDLSKNRYDDFDQLYTYCYRVAGVVGLIMLKIFGCSSDKAIEHAINLGVAMQLTNILRDINEDYERGRIYIPQNEMKQFNISEQDIRMKNLNDNLISLLKYQIQRARTYYADSLNGIGLISDKRARLVVCAMKDIYASILEQIEKNNYDVFSKRACVNTAGKILLLSKILLKGEYRCA